ncbi:MAG: hypothetical protein P9F75_07345 [Candidatus Contendobacter sp.]|nr:hypothetical protein [Candidatus Contendobacter sp.]
MPLTNLEINEAFEGGRFLRRSWSKAPTQTTASGIWFDLSMSPGNPFAQYYFATPLQATALARSADGGLDHGPPVAAAGYRKFLHGFNIGTPAATCAPLTVELLDYLAYWPGIAMDTGVQDLTTGIAIPRWTAAQGTRLMVVEQNPYVGGAQFRVTYEDQRGLQFTTPTLVCNTQVSAGTIAASASALSGQSGLFLPLADGCAGVARPVSIEFLTPDVGLVALVLVKPVAAFQINEITAPHYYELPRDFGVLPEIKDDAYLNLVALPVGTLAGTTLQGDLITLWSPA